MQSHLTDSSTIVRKRVPDGATTVLGSFVTLSDMCSFTVATKVLRNFASMMKALDSAGLLSVDECTVVGIGCHAIPPASVFNHLGMKAHEQQRTEAMLHHKSSPPETHCICLGMEAVCDTHAGYVVSKISLLTVNVFSERCARGWCVELLRVAPRSWRQGAAKAWHLAVQEERVLEAALQAFLRA
jgi:hypothetical protein